MRLFLSFYAIRPYGYVCNKEGRGQEADGRRKREYYSITLYTYFSLLPSALCPLPSPDDTAIILTLK